MPNVVFVAPFFLPTTLRFVESPSARLPGVTTGAVESGPDRADCRRRATCPAGRPFKRVDERTRRRRACAKGVSSELAAAPRLGRPSLLGALEELQVPLGRAAGRIFRSPGWAPRLGRQFPRQVADEGRAPHPWPSRAPDTRWRTTPGPPPRPSPNPSGTPSLSKPPAGLGGARARPASKTREQLDDCLRSAPPVARTPGARRRVHHGATSTRSTRFRSVGRVVWHSINHYFPSPARGPAGTVDPVERASCRAKWTLRRYEPIRSVAGQVLDALGMDTGLSHMEWFSTTRMGPWLISEVGARPPGRAVHDADFLGARLRPLRRVGETHGLR